MLQLEMKVVDRKIHPGGCMKNMMDIKIVALLGLLFLSVHCFASASSKLSEEKKQQLINLGKSAIGEKPSVLETVPVEGVEPKYTEAELLFFGKNVDKLIQDFAMKFSEKEREHVKLAGFYGLIGGAGITLSVGSIIYLIKKGIESYKKSQKDAGEVCFNQEIQLKQNLATEAS